jgi:TonB-dependent starch-binding outer membrane protein SusC
MEKLKFKRCNQIAAFVLTAIFMAFSLGSYAQQRTLSGTVTDQAGAAIPGVTVVVKGTTTGTVTNLDGNYTLQVPADAAVLVFPISV